MCLAENAERQAGFTLMQDFRREKAGAGFNGHTLSNLEMQSLYGNATDGDKMMQRGNSEDGNLIVRKLALTIFCLGQINRS